MMKPLFLLGFLAAAAYGQYEDWWIYPPPEGGGPKGGRVHVIAVDPRRPAIVYAGAPSGLYKSTDGARQWAPVLTAPFGLPVYSIAIHPADSDILYAGDYGGVFKSTDGGASWSARTHVADAPISALLIDPANPSTIYAGALAERGAFKSTDGGDTWTPINEGLLVKTWQDRMAPPAIHALAMDAGQSGTIYAGTTEGVFKSGDGGGSWRAVNQGLPGTVIPALALSSGGSERPSMLIASVYGEVGGIFRSTDGGESWSAANHGVPNTDIVSLAAGASPGTIYAGSTLGWLYRSNDGGSTWRPANSGLPATGISTIAVAGGEDGFVYAGTLGAGVFRSTAREESWAAANTGFSRAHVRSIAVLPGTTGVLIAGTEGGGVFKSADGGETWSISNRGLGNAYVHALSARSDGSEIYAGTTDGGFYRSVDGGANWIAGARVPIPLLPFAQQLGAVQELITGPDRSSALLARAPINDIYVSRDNGLNWSEVDFGLPTSGVLSVAVDPANGATIYASIGPSGIVRSTDGGASWSVIAADLQYATALVIDPSNPSTLLAASHSIAQNKYGIWKSTDGGGQWFLLSPAETAPWDPIMSLHIDPSDSEKVYAIGESVFFRSTNGGVNWAPLQLSSAGVSSMTFDRSSLLVYALTYRGLFKSTDTGLNWEPLGSN